MRYGVLSDVHGNRHALEASVRDLRRLGVDAWLSLGDVIGYGPHPNECVEIIASLEAVEIAGNHELVAVGQLTGQASSPRAQRSHAWTSQVLRSDVREHLKQLPRNAVVDGVILTHGSLDDPERYLRSRAQAVEQLTELRRRHPDARMLLHGHTHLQWAVDESGQVRHSSGMALSLDPAMRYLLNPGSVGQSRQWEFPPRARALLLDVSQSRVLFRGVLYDVARSWYDASRAELPYRSLHSPPALSGVVRRRLGRLRRLVG